MPNEVDADTGPSGRVEDDDFVDEQRSTDPSSSRDGDHSDVIPVPRPPDSGQLIDGDTPVERSLGPTQLLAPVVQHQASVRSRRPLWNNTVTIIALFVTQITVALLLTFWLFTLVTPTTNPYVDIVGYLILPGVLVIGAAFIPLGILFKSWRLRRRDPSLQLAFRFPRIDLNDPAQRRIAKYFLLGTFALLPIVGVTSYHGYHYTDSTQFCATACHAVMNPQATTYEFSAHARVTCAECHIGSGASWFVRSKLSGTRQVLAMWNDSFSRPIAPAIRHLRPARDTCERCHWPKKFFGSQLRQLVHFKSDEHNTKYELDMLLNTGGGDESIGRAEGIHMHMALAGQIEYVATDDELQDISWVRMTDKAGRQSIYRSDGRPNSDPRPDGDIRQLDCMDCHNRPAHKFRSPQEAVDLYLETGRIDTQLPFIKRQAVAVLTESYPDVDTAEARIGASLTEYYQENYPELIESNKASVHGAIDGVRDIYRRYFFPDMKVNWQTYPDNIGHLYSSGCFRCHDGKHVNQRNERISHECSTCHTFLNPLKNGGKIGVIQQGEFVHPYELQGGHATLRCDQCHTGGAAPIPTCTGCHEQTAAFRSGTLRDFNPFGIRADVMAESVDCESCHDLDEPATLASVDAMCMDCHEDSEEAFEGMLSKWDAEVQRRLALADAVADDAGRKTLATLRRVGPLHNVEATRAILDRIINPPPPTPKPIPEADPVN